MNLPRVKTWLRVLKNLAAIPDLLLSLNNSVNAPITDLKLWREHGMLQQRVERLEDRVQGLTRLYAGDDLAERLPTRHDAVRVLPEAEANDPPGDPADREDYVEPEDA